MNTHFIAYLHSSTLFQRNVHTRLAQPEDQVVQKHHILTASLQETCQQLKLGASLRLDQTVHTAIRDSLDSALERDDCEASHSATVELAPDGDGKNTDIIHSYCEFEEILHWK